MCSSTGCVQDVAYESLLRSSRRRYHERIAQALPRELPNIVETQPEFLAYHLIEAGKNSEAIAYLLRAGELAHRRSANTEAIEHLRRALELARGLPESIERQKLELTLLISLGAPLTVSKGYSVPEVEQTYSRAGELCRAMGDDETPHFFRALYGTWRVHLLRAEYARGLEFGHQLLRLAESSGNDTQLGAAHRALGSTLYYLGDDPDAASHHLQEVIASEALARDRHSFLDELHDVTDPWITCHAYQSWSMWLTGRPAEAKQLCQRTLDLSRGAPAPVHPGAGLQLRLLAVSVAGRRRARPPIRHRCPRRGQGAGLRLLDRLGRDHAGLGPGRGGRPAGAAWS